MLAGGAVDLRMKEKVWCQSATLCRIDPAETVANHEAGHNVRPIFIFDIKNQLHARFAVKKNIHIGPESEILRALANVEAEPGFSLAGIAAVNLDQTIFNWQP